MLDKLRSHFDVTGPIADWEKARNHPTAYAESSFERCFGYLEYFAFILREFSFIYRSGARDTIYGLSNIDVSCSVSDAMGNVKDMLKPPLMIQATLWPGSAESDIMARFNPASLQCLLGVLFKNILAAPKEEATPLPQPSDIADRMDILVGLAISPIAIELYEDSLDVPYQLRVGDIQVSRTVLVP